MNRRRHAALAFVTTAAALGTAFAATPDSYEGRTLPEPVKQLVWQKACNLPDADGDCAAGDCALRRSDGTPFRPAVAPWQSMFMYEWSAAERTLGPAFAEGKVIGSVDDIEGQTRMALELVSGLPLQAKSAVDGPLTLNPNLARWVQRELLPPADHAMCGATAKDVYLQAFATPVRGLAETYAALHQKGMTRGITVSALSKSFDTQKGRFATACQQIGKKGPMDTEWVRVQECWWWLRRVATGTAEPVAQLVGEILRRYDEPTWKKIGRAFPKPPNSR